MHTKLILYKNWSKIVEKILSFGIFFLIFETSNEYAYYTMSWSSSYYLYCGIISKTKHRPIKYITGRLTAFGNVTK